MSHSESTETRDVEKRENYIKEGFVDKSEFIKRVKCLREKVEELKGERAQLKRDIMESDLLTDEEKREFLEVWLEDFLSNDEPG
jgi:hypothetical protein